MWHGGQGAENGVLSPYSRAFLLPGREGGDGFGDGADFQCRPDEESVSTWLTPGLWTLAFNFCAGLSLLFIGMTNYFNCPATSKKGHGAYCPGLGNEPFFGFFDMAVIWVSTGAFGLVFAVYRLLTMGTVMVADRGMDIRFPQQQQRQQPQEDLGIRFPRGLPRQEDDISFPVAQQRSTQQPDEAGAKDVFVAAGGGDAQLRSQGPTLRNGATDDGGVVGLHGDSGAHGKSCSTPPIAARQQEEGSEKAAVNTLDPRRSGGPRQGKGSPSFYSVAAEATPNSMVSLPSSRDASPSGGAVVFPPVGRQRQTAGATLNPSLVGETGDSSNNDKSFLALNTMQFDAIQTKWSNWNVYDVSDDNLRSYGRRLSLNSDGTLPPMPPMVVDEYDANFRSGQTPGLEESPVWVGDEGKKWQLGEGSDAGRCLPNAAEGSGVSSGKLGGADGSLPTDPDGWIEGEAEGSVDNPATFAHGAGWVDWILLHTDSPTGFTPATRQALSYGVIVAGGLFVAFGQWAAKLSFTATKISNWGPVLAVSCGGAISAAMLLTSAVGLSCLWARGRYGRLSRLRKPEALSMGVAVVGVGLFVAVIVVRQRAGGVYEELDTGRGLFAALVFGVASTAFCSVSTLSLVVGRRLGFSVTSMFVIRAFTEGLLGLLSLLAIFVVPSFGRALDVQKPLHVIFLLPFLVGLFQALAAYASDKTLQTVSGPSVFPIMISTTLPSLAPLLLLTSSAVVSRVPPPSYALLFAMFLTLLGSLPITFARPVRDKFLGWLLLVYSRWRRRRLIATEDEFRRQGFYPLLADEFRLPYDEPRPFTPTPME